MSLYHFRKTEPRKGYEAAYEVRRDRDDLLLGTVHKEVAINVGLRGGDEVGFTAYDLNGKRVYSWPPTRQHAAAALERHLDERSS